MWILSENDSLFICSVDTRIVLRANRVASRRVASTVLVLCGRSRRVAHLCRDFSKNTKIKSCL